jgi:hypothetical protein
MPGVAFDRDALARRYASRHLKTDPGIREIHYLPTGAPERDIRLIEVNELIADRDNYPFEPIDFGVDVGGSEGHTLWVLDVTPTQWEKIRQSELRLPEGWNLDGAKPFVR